MVFAPRFANASDIVPVPQPTPAARSHAGEIQEGLGQMDAPATHEVLISIRVRRQERRQGLAHRIVQCIHWELHAEATSVDESG
jgi:hypothetical protein